MYVILLLVCIFNAKPSDWMQAIPNPFTLESCPVASDGIPELRWESDPFVHPAASKNGEGACGMYYVYGRVIVSATSPV